MRVLIIEDDIALAQSIQELLKENHILSDTVFDGADGIDYGLSLDYDVILLDIMLPKVDGFEVLKQLRSQQIETPIIFLSAKSAIEDKIHGLNHGADDYLTKPFNHLELIARIKAVSRRKGEVVLNTLTFGDLILDIETHTLKTTFQSIHLAAKEYELMELFMGSPNQHFSKELLISRVWGYDSEAVDNNVEAYVSFLRKKLDYLQSKVTIETIRKVGYHLSYD